MFILYLFFSIMYVSLGALVVAFVSSEIYDLDWPYSEGNKNTDEENARLVMIWAFWPILVIYAILYVIWLGLKYLAKAVMFYLNKMKYKLKLIIRKAKIKRNFKLTNRKAKQCEKFINDTEKTNEERNWNAVMDYVNDDALQAWLKKKIKQNSIMESAGNGWTD